MPAIYRYLEKISSPFNLSSTCSNSVCEGKLISNSTKVSNELVLSTFASLWKIFTKTQLLRCIELTISFNLIMLGLGQVQLHEVACQIAAILIAGESSEPRCSLEAALHLPPLSLIRIFVVQIQIFGDDWDLRLILGYEMCWTQRMTIGIHLAIGGQLELS